MSEMYHERNSPDIKECLPGYCIYTHSKPGKAKGEKLNWLALERRSQEEFRVLVISISLTLLVFTQVVI